MYLADNKTLEIEGKEDVSIQTPAGNQWTLQDVRYILGLKKNLISIGQLDSTGYAAEFGKSSWKIVKCAVTTLNFHILRVATNVSCSSIMQKYNSYMNIIDNVNFKKNV